MGQAREVMERVTAAVKAGDAEALAACYAEDAAAETPDAGRLEGREAVVGYMRAFTDAFSDVDFEMIATTESGDTAVDEAYLLGRHTAPMVTPDGEIPATGRQVRIRECDILVVANGKGVMHRFYFDQLDLMTQLGLTEVQPATELPAQREDGAEKQQPV